MLNGKRIVLVSGLLGLLAVCAALWLDWRIRRASAAVSDMAPERPLAGVGILIPTVPGDDALDRAAVVSSDAVRGAVARAPTPSSRLRILVLDALERPVAGIECCALRTNSAGNTWIDALFAHAGSVVATQPTNEQGLAELDLPDGVVHDVLVPARLDARFGRTRLRDCVGGQTHTVHLADATRLLGFVTRAADGTPVANARVSIQPVERGGLFRWSEPVRSDAAGRYVIDGLHPGTWLVEVIAEEALASELRDVSIDAGQPARLDFALAATCTLQGQVVDGDSREPIGAALVGESPLMRKSVRTDALGRFELCGSAASRELDLCAVAPGYGRTRRIIACADVAAAGEYLVLELRRGCSLGGRLVDMQGVPIEGARVGAAALPTASPDAPEMDRITTRTTADGRFELAGLARERSYVIALQAEGFATGCFELTLAAAAQSELDAGDIELPAQAVIAGRVVDAQDSPVADARVVLQLESPPSADAESGPLPEGVLQASTRRVGCDAQGRFAVGELVPGVWELSLAAPEGRPAARLRLYLAAGETRQDVELRLGGQGAAIAGRVLDPEGHAITAAGISLGGATQDGQALRAKSGADGGFRFDSLLDGTYWLSVQPREQRLRDDLCVTGAFLTDLRPGQEDLVVTLGRANPITGVVRDEQEQPLDMAMIAAREAQGADVCSALSDDRGRFELFVPEGSVVDVVVVRRSVGAPTGASQAAAVGGPGPIALRGVKAGTRGLELRPGPD